MPTPCWPAALSTAFSPEVFPLENYYQLLGLSPGASQEEIKRQFRRLAKQLHPDSQAGGDGEPVSSSQFERLHQAYSVLSDENRRWRYDQLLKQQQGHAGGKPTTGNTAASRPLAVIDLYSLAHGVENLEDFMASEWDVSIPRIVITHLKKQLLHGSPRVKQRLARVDQFLRKAAGSGGDPHDHWITVAIQRAGHRATARLTISSRNLQSPDQQLRLDRHDGAVLANGLYWQLDRQRRVFIISPQDELRARARELGLPAQAPPV